MAPVKLASSFSDNYLILKQQELSLVDLVRMLWRYQLAEEKAAVEFPAEEKEENLKHRKVIIQSLIIQKLLQSIAKRPLAWFGSTLETWLNLLSSNQNLFVLFLNVLRGKVIKPDKESEKFLSFIGNLDLRVKLDENIKPGDDRYYPALCMMASKIAYENQAFVQATVKDHWKMELIDIGGFHFWNDYQEKATTEAFMIRTKTGVQGDIIVIAFRGTEAFNADDWCTDFDISWYQLYGNVKIHGGFMKALGLVKDQGWPKGIERDSNRPLAYYNIRNKLKEILLGSESDKRTKFILTGHSLGGALAILFPAILGFHQEYDLLKRFEGVYTFGQPRVGDEELKIFMEKVLVKYGIRYLRFVYSNDWIPRLPADDSRFLFKHFGTCLYYNSFYNGKILEEEPNKNDPGLLATIPSMVNALWEVIRSFILPYKKGPDYAETWLLRLVRFVGLAVPGMADHNPHDYVNLTRLGSIHT